VILVVDDETLIRELVVDALSVEGMEAQGAASGEAGVEIFQADHDSIELVILDMLMPGMDGIETFGRLKEIDPDVRVIISTGYSDSEQTNRLIKADVKHLLRKPYRIAELIDIVRLTLMD